MKMAFLSHDEHHNVTMQGRYSCNDNAETFFERLHCERFRKDEIGPWYMFSNGMTEETYKDLATQR